MITSITFSKYLTEPQQISLNDIMMLENITKKHPYFQLGYSLIAKGIHSKAPDIAAESIKKAAAHALSRNALRKVIENKMDWVTATTSKYAEKFDETDGVEMPSEVNEDELLAAIASNKSVNSLDQQLEIIDRFIQTEPRISKINEQVDENEIEDLSEQSTTLSKPLFTESFAKILIRQAKIADAIEVYRNLMTQNPEKSAYFAAKIEEINKKYNLA